MDKKTLIAIFLLLPCLLFCQTVNIDSSSIGTASRDYSTIGGWETAKDGDLVTADTTRKGVCFKDAVFDEQVVVDGSITSDSTYMWLTVAPNDRHNGIDSSGVRIENTAALGSGAVIELRDEDIHLEWIEITEGIGGSAEMLVRAGVSNIYNIEINNMLIYKGNLTGLSLNASLASSIAKIYNNLIYKNVSGTNGANEVIIADPDWTVYFYNNSIWFTATSEFKSAVNLVSGTVIAKNNIVIGSGASNTAWEGTYDAASTHNGSDDTSSPGGNSQDNLVAANEWVSVTSGSEDLHIKSTASVKDAGTDLSNDSNQKVTDDIDEDTRPQGPAFDMGADEFLSAPAGGQPATPKKGRPRWWGIKNAFNQVYCSL